MNTKIKTDQAPSIPDQSLDKFSITETESGDTHWTLEASSAQIMESEKKVLLQLPVIKFYEKGQYSSTLVAEKGRINTENYDLWGEGKCRLDTSKGDKLETTNLYYKSDVKKIITNEKVKLTRKQEVIYGEGLEASPNLDSIKIKKENVEIDSNDGTNK